VGGGADRFHFGDLGFLILSGLAECAGGKAMRGSIVRRYGHYLPHNVQRLCWIIVQQLPRPIERGTRRRPDNRRLATHRGDPRLLSRLLTNLSAVIALLTLCEDSGSEQ
jgi:hypothetical protein